MVKRLTRWLSSQIARRRAIAGPPPSWSSWNGLSADEKVDYLETQIGRLYTPDQRREARQRLLMTPAQHVSEAEALVAAEKAAASPARAATIEAMAQWVYRQKGRLLNVPPRVADETVTDGLQRLADAVRLQALEREASRKAGARGARGRSVGHAGVCLADRSAPRTRAREQRGSCDNTRRRGSSRTTTPPRGSPDDPPGEGPHGGHRHDIVGGLGHGVRR